MAEPSKYLELLLRHACGDATVCITCADNKLVLAAIAMERERCMKGYESLKAWFVACQEFEYAQKVQDWITELREPNER